MYPASTMMCSMCTHGNAIMSQQFQMTAAPLWKLAGLALLLISFSFTGWILGNAVVATYHLIEVLVDFVRNAAPIFGPDTHTMFTP